jgi:hypothetical protein
MTLNDLFAAAYIVSDSEISVIHSYVHLRMHWK